MCTVETVVVGATLVAGRLLVCRPYAALRTIRISEDLPTQIQAPLKPCPISEIGADATEAAPTQLETCAANRNEKQWEVEELQDE